MTELNTQEEAIHQILCSFSCRQDSNIETFLHNHAIEFEKLSKSRTYLICSEMHLKNHQIDILGYFSLALKTLSIPETISNRYRKELDGFSAKFHGKPIQDIPCYLIGQLARNSNTPKEIFSGKELFSLTYDVIAAAVPL